MTMQKIGDLIRVNAKHWLRPNSMGKIIELNPRRGEAMYLVEFETAFPGGGIDENKLWLSPGYLEDMTNTK